MEITIKTSTVFKKTESAYYSNKYSIIANIGSSRSGKSYAILQLLCLLLLSKKMLKVTCWRNMKTVCKGTLMADFKNIIFSDPYLISQFVHNKAEGSFTCKKNGSYILFEGTDNEEKVHGLSQDISFFNEITEMSEAVYDQIVQRTSESVFVDYNPSKSFWFDKYLTHETTKVIHSTFKSNPFISQKIINKLKSYEPWLPGSYEIIDKVPMYKGKKITTTNQPPPHPFNVKNGTANTYMWLVYGLGIGAEKPNRVYKDWDTCSKVYFDNLEYKSYYGLDFGVSNPTALVEVKFDGDNTFYVNEMMYKPISEMGMPLYKYLRDNYKKISENDILVCDSAKLALVSDLQGANYTAVPAIKGPGSIERRITNLQGFRVVYTNTSFNLDMEYSTYSYDLDRYGLVTDRIVSKDDHLLDAIGYCCDYILRSLGVIAA